MFPPGRGEWVPQSEDPASWVGALQRHSNTGSATRPDFTCSCSAHVQSPCPRDSISKDATHPASCLVVVLQARCLQPNHAWLLFHGTDFAVKVLSVWGSLPLCNEITHVLKTLWVLRLSPWFTFWGPTFWSAITSLSLLSLVFLLSRLGTHWNTIFFSLSTPPPHPHPYILLENPLWDFQSGFSPLLATMEGTYQTPL